MARGTQSSNRGRGGRGGASYKPMSLKTGQHPKKILHGGDRGLKRDAVHRFKTGVSGLNYGTIAWNGNFGGGRTTRMIGNMRGK